MDNWEDLMNSDEEIELNLGKEGEIFQKEDLKVEKAAPLVVAEVTDEEKQKHAEAAEKKRKAKAKFVEEAARDLTVDEKRRIEEQVKQNDQKMAADLFGGDASKSMLDINLESEEDYIKFAKVVHSKIQFAKSRGWIVEFLGKLFKELDGQFTSKEFSDTQAKITPLMNACLTKEKGKDKKKSKKGPSIMSVTQKNNKDLYKEYHVDGQDDGEGNLGGTYAKADDEEDFM